MSTLRIYWQQRRDIHKEHFYEKDDEELYWKTFQKISHSWKINIPARAIIVPNIGWRYCATTQAKAYRQVDFNNVKKIFIFAPILNFFCPKACCLASFDSYSNPIFRTSIDPTVVGELEATKVFSRINWKRDEQELTIESQLPFITTLLFHYRGKFTIVPIYVGALGIEEQKIYGAIFSKYLTDPNNLFVFSFNFHHWGTYFDFTFQYPKDKSVKETLHKLLAKGIDFIKPLDPEKYLDYCLFMPGTFVGRHVLGILMYAIQTIKNREIEKINELDEEERINSFITSFQLKFLEKGVSHPDCKIDDHCFSFASASLVMKKVKLINVPPVPDAPLDKRQ